MTLYLYIISGVKILLITPRMFCLSVPVYNALIDMSSDDFQARYIFYSAYQNPK